MKATSPILKVGDRTVYSTKDYTIFKGMDGNRDVDAKHVKQLQKLMLENGNLTYEFPIIVNKDMFVVDGQHRLKALEGLGWEVGYTIQAEATIEVVRAINRGNRNWSWIDVASSYAKLGSTEYKWFIWFATTYRLALKGALAFAGFGGERNTARQEFHGGELVVKDKTKAVQVAEGYRELSDACDVDNSTFMLAYNSVCRSPFYDQRRMVQKAGDLASTIPQRASKSDYMRSLEEVFNHKLSDDNRVRLF